MNFSYFVLIAKQAIREQGLPFQPKLINKGYDKKAYQLAMENTKYNSEGKAVIEADDEWRKETKWDEFKKHKKHDFQNMIFALKFIM